MAGAGAGASDKSRTLLRSPSEAAVGKRRREKWEVEFARYFLRPRRGPATPPPPGLRYISRGKLRHQGTWLPAASPATLRIAPPSHSFAAPVLTVSIGDVVYEEHHVYTLNFSWPQVACMTQCPIRGSRVVFMSFCDQSKQIQKFAVRFPHLSDAESFLNSVKECSRNTIDILTSRSDYVCEDSSSSEYTASDGLQYRLDEATNFEEPTSYHGTYAPAVSYHEEPDQPVLRSPRATNIDEIYSGFPHCYSEVLTSYSIKNEKDGEEPCLATATDHAPENAYILDGCHDVSVAGNESIADKGKVGGKEVDANKETCDLLAGMKTYGTDDSFHDMLSKLDKAIDELGGDMLL
ncbi:protein POOR HOMOLOGOUS SYNAPSIS 1 isoform X3 [Brachypodium distachyon]|uniref:protein POOR HOMOLOGOUS SYNAPSIS 1 isoform X3 n=1 Tax=Brachypodium distachyon TaxID=15368 RepID=UPI000D0D6DBE|nr:protein POOR HOMOLOGOUS SYNAPSIS 1 isoform X3 [Brachypodium distachyon]|eukprot:XP_024313598.1 protein POOR HOMOLOGOUS SYNAPSIS 1 isoform X3 [Brachypodium distachyon]